MYENLAILAIFAFFFSVIAGKVERGIIGGPIIFISFGLLAGPMGVGLLDFNVNNVQLRVIADLTLALVLFIDAANADLSVLGSHSRIPQRMLIVGLPLCIALGVVCGLVIFPGVSLFELCVLATMLAATDAALGKAVVTNKAVPARVREGLNAESGLNDGLCVPILFVFLALAAGSVGEEGGTALALKLVAKEIGIGLVVGLGLTALGAGLIAFCWRRGWMTEIWLQIPVVVLAFACFATAQSLHGSGYIAAFVGGLLFGHLAKSETHKLVFAAEGTSELLAMVTWIIFGAAVIGQSWGDMSWQIVLYSVLSLTVIRMLPMVLSLTGSGEPMESKLFLGWFGPRGLASIVFAIIVANEHLPNSSILINTVVCTVTMSVIAHGLTANPLSKAFCARMKRYESIAGT
jgi:NhaP-type Na+/H+ or K+/H+ antiporter